MLDLGSIPRIKAMRLDTTAGNFFVDFIYDHAQGITRCRVTNEERGITVEEVALRHPNDAFEKRVGRRLAFERAVQQLPKSVNNRGLRSELWSAFKQKVRV